MCHSHKYKALCVKYLSINIKIYLTVNILQKIIYICIVIIHGSK